MPGNKPFTRHLTILRCLRDTSRCYTWSMLRRECEYATGGPISKSTLDHDISALRSRYGVDIITCGGGASEVWYRLADPMQRVEGLDLSDMETSQLRQVIDALDMRRGTPLYDWLVLFLSAIDEQGLQMADARLIEFQGNAQLRFRPEHFRTILKAIRDRVPLQVGYKTFTDRRSAPVASPYRLVQRNDRWYMVCRLADRTDLTLYPLDRIVNVWPADASHAWQESPTDIDAYLAEMIGTTHGSSQLEEVVLRFTAERYPYVETKPIHASQTEDTSLRTDTHRVVRLHLIVNRELVQLLLSFGPDVEVLAPQTLRDALTEKIRRMNEIYFPIAENLQP